MWPTTTAACTLTCLPIEPIIALPFHPSNTYTIHELQENAEDILHLIQDNANKQIKGAQMDIVSKFHDGGHLGGAGRSIAGCAGGTFDNICAAADILRGRSCGNGAFSLQRLPRLHARPGGAHEEWPGPSDSDRRRCHPPGMLLRTLLRRGRHPRQRRASPSGTPPGTSPTGRAPSPARARWLPWP